MDPTARDEAVRRLRDESARRLDRHGRRRTLSSWCALAAMVAGLSLMALEADRARRRELEAARRAAIAERIRLEQERIRSEARPSAPVRPALPDVWTVF